MVRHAPCPCLYGLFWFTYLSISVPGWTGMDQPRTSLSGVCEVELVGTIFSSFLGIAGAPTAASRTRESNVCPLMSLFLPYETKSVLCFPLNSHLKEMAI